jgi:ABC-2 type transport system ATP-binding protein
VSGTAIEIAGVSKRFRIYREKPMSLKARLLAGRIRAEDFWALRDVTFDVATGESFALIGHNGSGKSTLLKVIAGFHMELTGRENVYLNAAFLGLSRKETDRVYDDIVAFAELEDFMETQVKFYSSGMLVRLGFACAIHVDPEILLIDEVLAVGDEAFQAKCLDRVRWFQKEGRTIILVTHALDLVRQICDQAVMLDHGSVHAIGAPDDVVREMRMTILHRDLAYAHEEGSKEVEIVGVSLRRGDSAIEGSLHPGDVLTLEVELQAHQVVDDPVVSFALHDGTNNFVFGGDTAREHIGFGTPDGSRLVRFDVGPLPFTGGKYWVTLGVHSRDNERVYHVQDQRYSFDVTQTEDRRDQLFMPVRATVEGP